MALLSLLPPQYPFALGLLMAVVFSTLVCLSRLYTGMHTVLVSPAVRPSGDCPYDTVAPVSVCSSCCITSEAVCVCHYISLQAIEVSHYYFVA